MALRQAGSLGRSLIWFTHLHQTSTTTRLIRSVTYEEQEHKLPFWVVVFWLLLLTQKILSEVPALLWQRWASQQYMWLDREKLFQGQCWIRSILSKARWDFYLDNTNQSMFQLEEQCDVTYWKEDAPVTREALVEGVKVMCTQWCFLDMAFKTTHKRMKASHNLWNHHN